jgi:hypothetical protein
VEDVEEKEVLYTDGGTLVKLVKPLLKTLWRLLIKLKIDVPYDPATPLLGIHPKE